METVAPPRPRFALAAVLALIGAAAAALVLWLIVGRVMVAARIDAAPLMLFDFPITNSPRPSFLEQNTDVDLSYAGVNLRLDSAPADLKWLDYWATTTEVATIALLGMLVCVLALLALRGRPFVLRSALLFMGAGVVAVAISWVGDFLRGQLQRSVIAYLGTGSTAGGDESGTREGFVTITSYDPSVIATGLILFAVGLTFLMAARMQRDVERLV